jgi:hypothetical protein
MIRAALRNIAPAGGTRNRNVREEAVAASGACVLARLFLRKFGFQRHEIFRFA